MWEGEETVDLDPRGLDLSPNFTALSPLPCLLLCFSCKVGKRISALFAFSHIVTDLKSSFYIVNYIANDRIYTLVLIFDAI